MRGPEPQLVIHFVILLNQINRANEFEKVVVYILNGPSILSHNEENPDIVKISELTISNVADQFEYTFPPRSLVIIVLERA